MEAAWRLLAPPSRLSPPSFPLSQTFTHKPFMSERKLQVIATSKLKALKDTRVHTHTHNHARTHSSLKHSRAATVCEVCLSVSGVIDYQLISRSDRTRSLILSDFQKRLLVPASFDPSDPLFFRADVDSVWIGLSRASLLWKPQPVVHAG